MKNTPGGPMRGRAAGQGMVFGISALIRVYNFMRTCPKQGILFLNRFKRVWMGVPREH